MSLQFWFSFRARWLLVSGIGVLSACVNTVQPPTLVDDAATVYLVDHGRHPSLVLPDGESGFVRFAYGDWRWFALSEESLWRGASALLWPSKAALARRAVDETPNLDNISRAIVEGWQHITPIEVNRFEVDKLREHLEASFYETREQKVFNPLYNLEFVPYPANSYWWLQNSNSKMAEWLRELGCEVKGAALFSAWRIVGSPTDSQP